MRSMQGASSPAVVPGSGTDDRGGATKAGAVFGLFESLDDQQLATAELAGACDDIVMGPGVDAGYPEQEGLPYAGPPGAAGAGRGSRDGLGRGHRDDDLSAADRPLRLSQFDETTINWATSTDRTQLECAAAQASGSASEMTARSG